MVRAALHENHPALPPYCQYMLLGEAKKSWILNWFGFILSKQIINNKYGLVLGTFLELWVIRIFVALWATWPQFMSGLFMARRPSVFRSMLEVYRLVWTIDEVKIQNILPDTGRQWVRLVRASVLCMKIAFCSTFHKQWITHTVWGVWAPCRSMGAFTQSENCWVVVLWYP